MKKVLLFFPAVALCIIACDDSARESETETYVLREYERDLCVKHNIDTTLIASLFEIARPELKSFRPDSVFYFDATGHWSYRPSELEGVMFDASTGQAATLCERYGKDFISKGHTIYIFEQYSGTDGTWDKVAVVNTADKYEILRETGTDGINYDIDNDSLISIIRTFDTEYNLTLTGAGPDWCQFTINNQPRSWQVMAEEVYEVCPDVVDQGTGSVEDLAVEMEKFKTLYLWWD